ncbi:MAG TPA: hypothetical protein VFM88_15480 [Vicinamibacteria bacterium]|nr:hypothetical protein [Vicinamibacteria bacterium]
MLALLLAALAAPSAGQEPRLEVTGEVVGQTDDALDVRVGLTNRGDADVPSLRAEGELFGHVESRALDQGLARGATSGLPFSFPLRDARPGVHAVSLRLDYEAAATGDRPARSIVQVAYVLVALGESPPPAVRIFAPDARMDSVGRWRVALESDDAAAHRVRLRVILPRTLRADPLESTVEVPAAGRVEKELLLFRVDAPWEAAQGALLVAATDGEPVTRTTVATALVQVGREPGRMPRLRRPLAAAMGLLFLAAFALELRRYLRARA